MRLLGKRRKSRRTGEQLLYSSKAVLMRAHDQSLPVAVFQKTKVSFFRSAIKKLSWYNHYLYFLT